VGRRARGAALALSTTCPTHSIFRIEHGGWADGIHSRPKGDGVKPCLGAFRERVQTGRGAPIARLGASARVGMRSAAQVRHGCTQNRRRAEWLARSMSRGERAEHDDRRFLCVFTWHRNAHGDTGERLHCLMGGGRDRRRMHQQSLGTCHPACPA
jgi:hypothetical protein